eukprot:maker-scaffold143_size313727-snap-gene-2.18 protein:Tk09419 transcript:maker-scaffold143_size313727-snap-gene-2.18-mRNA-1 annotation:"alpha-tubulin n-acetyltransferase isoform x2"
MEFAFDLNPLFPTDIVRLGPDMLPTNLVRAAVPFKNLSLVQQRMSFIIDCMGNASAQAQDLKQAITSGSKVRAHSGEHIVYLLVDKTSQGCVIGLLKVGKKNLFLMDRQGSQNEVYSMCILDFYVHESRQRSGCGRQLFEHMLQDQGLDPQFMAIDRPSPKLLGFLAKYHNLSNPIPQVNNYVIYDGFFNNNNKECSPGPKRARIYMGKLQYV